MNAVEIADAVADLAAQPFDAAEFPFQFLAAFDKKETQLKRLRKGDTNRSDVLGGVLLQSNIHLALCPAGETHATLGLLKASQQTMKAKAKFILSTDGQTLEAEELSSGESIASEFPKLAEHVGFFLPLAGISTVREIKDNPIDVRATGRLNKLYVELLRQNPEWGTEARRHDMNHFMARLIFCFFAEDTDIFPGGQGLFTSTIQQFTESDGSNTHTVLGTLFRAMNIAPDKRDGNMLPGWAGQFPYVNGGLFCDTPESPVFTRIARSYLLQAGELDWKHINPDIFGSMIQAVADKGEREQLGMHYTSVPNILKVLNPLFLDGLRDKLAAAGNNKRTLLALRSRLSRIRVFDPACGSGNFLVIAYKQLREMEASINTLLQERPSSSALSLRNFRGIELRDFAAEIARLALVIAEYQANVLYLGEQQARLVFLPLSSDNWIRRDNALRCDWLTVCPPEGGAVIRRSDDLFHDELEQTGFDFENQGGETYICGNPPYIGKGKLNAQQMHDMEIVFKGRTAKWGYVDYVGAWILKAADYIRQSGVPTDAALVSTNSVVMGRQVSSLWPIVLCNDVYTKFAHTSFLWSNNAKHNASVYCVIIGTSKRQGVTKVLSDMNTARYVDHISYYLTAGEAPLVMPQSKQIVRQLPDMNLGNKPNDGGALSFGAVERRDILRDHPEASRFIRRFYGSKEFNNDIPRYCLWIEDGFLHEASRIRPIHDRIELSRTARLQAEDANNQALAERPHQFREFNEAIHHSFVIPAMTSERREYLPCGVVGAGKIISSQAFTIFDAELWCLSLLLSRIHLIWIATICGKLKLDYRYSNDLGWNTFPVPNLTEKDKADLTRCAEDLLLAREAHFPATIADLYDPEAMPENLRAAHERNDETLERIYIGRRFKNDTERLETLFVMYAKMTGSAGAADTVSTARTRGRKKKESQA